MKTLNERRATANARLLDLLKEELLTDGSLEHLRFGQFLVNLRVVPDGQAVWNEEPETTLRRVEARTGRPVSEDLAPPLGSCDLNPGKLYAIEQAIAQGTGTLSTLEWEMVLQVLRERRQGAVVSPQEYAEAEREITGLNWMTLVNLAHAFRDAGFEIERKMEAECAFVLTRCLAHARQHGLNWRKAAWDELKAAKEARGD